MTCIGHESCDEISVTVSNVSSTLIECLNVESCSNMEINTNSWENTKLDIKEYSPNIIYGNSFGYNGDISNGFINLECNLNKHYIKFTKDNDNTELSDLIISRYNSNKYLPCDGIVINCHENHNCIMRSDNLVSTKPSLNEFGNNECFYADVSDLLAYRCVGECANSPTRSPTPSPTDAPTIITIEPTNIPSISPTLLPTFNPTLTPSGTPTRTPSTPPTSAPTDSPTTSPTNAPTDSPTRSPTIDAPFFGYILPVFIFSNISDGKLRLFQDPLVYKHNIEYVIEKGIFDSVLKVYSASILQYDQFEVNLIALNGVDINDNQILTSIPRDNIVKVSTNISCDTHNPSAPACVFVLDGLTKARNQFLNDVKIGTRIALTDDTLEIDIESGNLEIQTAEAAAMMDNTEEGHLYFYIVLGGLWAFIFIITLLAYLYNSNKCFRCSSRCKKTDDANWMSLVKWGMYTLTGIYLYI